MDVCEEPAGKSANTFKEEELPSSQHLNNSGCMNSLFWRKAVVYDCVEQTMQVLNEKDIGRSHALIVRVPR